MISVNQFRAIRAIILDVDGVMTDGRAGYGTDETVKFFNYRDGHWIRMALRAGFKVGMFSGCESQANRKRAHELNLNFCYENVFDKLSGFEKLLAEQHLTAQECLYIGDDIVDYPVMKRAGIAVAVADSSPELEEVAHWRTPSPGGHGAVCETIRWLMSNQGILERELERYRR